MQLNDNGGQVLSHDRIISTNFSPVVDIPHTAYVKLILSNVNERPIIYKFKREKEKAITAKPNSIGTVPAHGLCPCLLIWRRAPEIKNWKDMKSTSLLLITQFEGSNDPNINEHTVTKIKCHISSSMTCSSDKPPEEYITLKSSLSSVLSKEESSDVRMITPITGIQRLSDISPKLSQNTMNINKLQSLTNKRNYIAGFDDLEIKGTIVIVLIIAIIILCIQILLENNS